MTPGAHRPLDNATLRREAKAAGEEAGRAARASRDGSTAPGAWNEWLDSRPDAQATVDAMRSRTGAATGRTSRIYEVFRNAFVAETSGEEE